MKSPMRWSFMAVLVASGLLTASCSASSLPPVLATVPAEFSGQAAGPEVAPAVEAAVPVSESESRAQGIAVTALLTTEVEPAAAVAAAPPTLTPAPTDTPVPAEPTATPEPQKQVEVNPTETALRATQVVAPTRVPARRTATRVRPTATRVPPRPTPTRVKPTPTPHWPKTLTITEQDLEEQAGSVPGLQVTGLDVSFAENSMTLSASSLRYKIVSIRNLTVQGHFTASNCDVAFVADRIQPRNLATSAIPNLVNQTLDQQLGQWCVETIAITPGQLVATVSPR